MTSASTQGTNTACIVAKVLCRERFLLTQFAAHLSHEIANRLLDAASFVLKHGWIEAKPSAAASREHDIGQQRMFVLGNGEFLAAASGPKKHQAQFPKTKILVAQQVGASVFPFIFHGPLHRPRHGSKRHEV